MATLREALKVAKQEPNSERSKLLLKAIQSGKFDEIAVAEGIDISSIRSKEGISAKSQGAMGSTASFGETETVSIDRGEDVAPIPSVVRKPAEFLTGAAKGTASTAAGLSEIGQKGIKKVLEPLGVPVEDLGERPSGLKEALTPQSEAEELGFNVEQIAEFFIPTLAPTKAAKAPALLSKLSQLAKTEQGALKLQKAFDLAAKAAKEGVEFGAVTAAQEGDVGAEALASGVIGASGPVASKAVGKIAEGLKPAAGKASERIINSLVKPLKKHVAYGKNPGRGITKEGITANSLEELGEKVVNKKSEIGTQIDEALTVGPNANKEIDLPENELLGEFNKAISELERIGKRDRASIITRIKNLRDDVKDFAETGILSPLKVTEIKRNIGELTRFTGNASDDEAANTVLRNTYSMLKKKVDDVAPDVKDLNERYGDMLSADLAIKNREVIGGRQNLLPFTAKQLGGAVGTMTAVAQGGLTLDAALAGISAAMIEKALGSVTAKTNMAKALNALSKEDKARLAKSDSKVAKTLRKVFQAELAIPDQEQ